MTMAQIKIAEQADPAEIAGRRTCVPRSHKTGSAKAIFMPAYNTAFHAPAASGGSESANFPRPYQNTNMRSSGTRAEFSTAIPFVPRDKKSRTTRRPPSDASGRTEGRSASSPASIPAHGTNAAQSTAAFAAGAALRNSARSAPSYPPYFLPRRKKNTHTKK